MNQPTPERLNGIVVAVRFSSDNFGVAQFRQVRGGEISIIGDLTGIEEGQRLSLYGRGSTHPKHGPQFRVEYFHPYVEETREGIQRFLVEEVEGIGPALAQRIVSYFFPLHGESMLEYIQEHPTELAEIPGLGEAKRKALQDALHENYATRRFLLKLYEYGVSTSVARSIQKFYSERGIDALRILEHTPYQMVHDVPGIGFDTVERIARHQGLPFDDPGRIEAAVTHVLLRAFHRDGHFFLPEAPLLRHMSEIVWQGNPPDNFVDQVGDALEKLRVQRYVQIIQVGGDLAFYPRAAWLVEDGLVTNLTRLLDAPVPPLPYASQDPELVRQAAEARSGITLGEAQAQAFALALAAGVCVVTGGPGTGKSTIARLIVDSWEAAGLTVKLAAPTGRAARRLAETTGRAATTVHRLLEWREGEFQRNEEEPIEAGAILVDESSMLDASLAGSLCRAIPSGCRVLFMGDVDQLPSVGPGNVLHDLIESGMVPVSRLDRIYRQDVSRENLIVTLAHAINRAPPGQPIPGGPRVAGKPADGNVFLFDSRMPWARCTCGGVRLPKVCPTCGEGAILAPIPDTARGAELIQQLITERIPKTFGIASDDVQVIAPLYRGPLGVDELNERLRGVLNPARASRPELRFGHRQFRFGDRVMAVRNNYEKDVVNGLQGRIVDLDPGSRSVTVLFDGEVKATFKGEELDNLTHAYAITAHKSQGGEFPVVLLALDQSAGRLLYRQLLYTAVTRARELLILVGDPRALDRATANNHPRHRWTGLHWWLAN